MTFADWIQESKSPPCHELTIYLIFHSWDMPSHTAMLWLISAYSYFLVNKSNIPLRILRLGLVTLLEIELRSDAYCYSH